MGRPVKPKMARQECRLELAKAIVIAPAVWALKRVCLRVSKTTRIPPTIYLESAGNVQALNRGNDMTSCKDCPHPAKCKKAGKCMKKNLPKRGQRAAKSKARK